MKCQSQNFDIGILVLKCLSKIFLALDINLEYQGAFFTGKSNSNIENST